MTGNAETDKSEAFRSIRDISRRNISNNGVMNNF